MEPTTNDIPSGDINRLGKNITNARNSRSWKQEELAERSGLSRSAIAKIEGGSAVTTENLQKIADVFGIPIFMLLLRESDWKNLIKIFEAGMKAETLVRRAGPISQEEAMRIEQKSLSEAAKDNREAQSKISLVVYKMFPIQRGPNGKAPVDLEGSMQASVGMALKLIPHDPFINGIIAHLISK